MLVRLVCALSGSVLPVEVNISVKVSKRNPFFICVIVQGKGSSSSSYTGRGKAPAATAKSTTSSTARPAAGKTVSGFGSTAKKGYTDDYDDPKPELVEGWVEKKGGGRVKMGDGWQKRYLRIDEKNCCLSYYKTSRYRSRTVFSHHLNVASF